MSKCIYGYKPNKNFEEECKTHCVLHRAVVVDEVCDECVDRSESQRSEWLKLETRTYNGLSVKEIKCPYCGYKQTFVNKPESLTCYVCGNYSEYDV